MEQEAMKPTSRDNLRLAMRNLDEAMELAEEATPRECLLASIRVNAHALQLCLERALEEALK